MNELIEELSSILTQELMLYEQVREMLGAEREALVSGRPETVLEIVRRKETLLLKIRTLDESRRLICLRLAKAWRVPVSEVDLREAERRAEPKTALRLSDLRRRLTECLDKLRQQNDMNALICRNGTELIRQVVESVTQSVAEEKPGYGGVAPGKAPVANQASAPPGAVNVRT